MQSMFCQLRHTIIICKPDQHTTAHYQKDKYRLCKISLGLSMLITDIVECPISTSATHLVHVFPLGVFEENTHANDVIRSSIEEMEPYGCRGRPCHPDAIISSHGDHSEECGQPFQAGVINTPTYIRQ